eukprot:3865198-Rhodomonas_salina.1
MLTLGGQRRYASTRKTVWLCTERVSKPTKCHRKEYTRRPSIRARSYPDTGTRVPSNVLKTVGKSLFLNLTESLVLPERQFLKRRIGLLISML